VIHQVVGVVQWGQEVPPDHKTPDLVQQVDNELKAIS
jgi:hypothetical protein